MSGRTWRFAPLSASSQTYRAAGPVIELSMAPAEGEGALPLAGRQTRLEVTHPQARELVESFARWCAFSGHRDGQSLNRHRRATATAAWLRELADEIESRP